jgi:hypothetical protein
LQIMSTIDPDCRQAIAGGRFVIVKEALRNVQ